MIEIPEAEITSNNIDLNTTILVAGKLDSEFAVATSRSGNYVASYSDVRLVVNEPVSVKAV